MSKKFSVTVKVKRTNYKGDDVEYSRRIGTLFMNDNGQNGSLVIDAIPTGDWNGELAVFEEK